MRVRVVNQPNEPFEGTLEQSRPREVLREGGGSETVLYEWLVRRDSGDSEWVPQEAVSPIQ
jgi:hypothetical protein